MIYQSTSTSTDWIDPTLSRVSNDDRYLVKVISFSKGPGEHDFLFDIFLLLHCNTNCPRKASANFCVLYISLCVIPKQGPVHSSFNHHSLLIFLWIISLGSDRFKLSQQAVVSVWKYNLIFQEVCFKK